METDFIVLNASVTDTKVASGMTTVGVMKYLSYTNSSMCRQHSKTIGKTDSEAFPAVVTAADEERLTSGQIKKHLLSVNQ